MTTYTIRRDEFGRMPALSEIMDGTAETTAPAAQNGYGPRRSSIRLQIEAMQIGDEIEVTERSPEQVSAIAGHVRAERPGTQFRVSSAPTCAIVRRIA